MGLYSSDANNFVFQKGEKVLIAEIVDLVKLKIQGRDSKGAACVDFSFFKFNKEALNCLAVKTRIGLLFGQNEIRKINNTKKLPKTNRVKTVAAQSHCRDGKESEVQLLPLMFETIKQILEESCLLRMKECLKNHIKSNSREECFLKECNLVTVDDLKVAMILIDETDLNRALASASIDDNHSKTHTQDMFIKVKITCYCSTIQWISPFISTNYFHCTQKWRQMLSTANVTETFIESLSKSWSLYNFQRHLTSHSKYYKLNKLKESVNSKSGSACKISFIYILKVIFSRKQACGFICDRARQTNQMAIIS